MEELRQQGIVVKNLLKQFLYTRISITVMAASPKNPPHFLATINVSTRNSPRTHVWTTDIMTINTWVIGIKTHSIQHTTHTYDTQRNTWYTSTYMWDIQKKTLGTHRIANQSDNIYTSMHISYKSKYTSDRHQIHTRNTSTHQTLTRRRHNKAHSKYT